MRKIFGFICALAIAVSCTVVSFAAYDPVNDEYHMTEVRSDIAGVMSGTNVRFVCTNVTKEALEGKGIIRADYTIERDGLQTSGHTYITRAYNTVILGGTELQSEDFTGGREGDYVIGILFRYVEPNDKITVSFVSETDYDSAQPTFGGDGNDVLNLYADKEKGLTRSEYYWRSTLSYSEKLVYDAIEDAAYSYETEIPMPTEITSDRLSYVYELFRLDHPEVFWWSPGYGYNEDYSSGNITEMRALLRFDPQTIEIMKGEIETEVQKILALLPNNATDIEAELIFHDYLSKNITYGFGEESTGDRLCYDLYGALVKGECVCEGYAEAFQYLCQRVGIPCIGITGRANGGGHKWNGVQIGNRWYLVDVTWDDVDADGDRAAWTSYKYFNAISSNMTSHATDTELVENLPEFTATEASLFDYYDLICDDSDPSDEFICALEFFAERADGDSFTVELMGANEELADDSLFVLLMDASDLIEAYNNEHGTSFEFAYYYYPVSDNVFGLCININ